MLNAFLSCVAVTLILAPSAGAQQQVVTRYAPHFIDTRFEVEILSGTIMMGSHRPRRTREQVLADERRGFRWPWDPVEEEREWSTIYRNAQNFELQNVPIILPLIMNGAFSEIDYDSLDARLYLSHREDLQFGARSYLEDAPAYGQKLAIMPIDYFYGRQLKWQLSFRSAVWNTRIDEAAAERISWPDDWPDDVKRALWPEKYIESNSPLFIQTVEQLAGDQLRKVSPYFAAKDLVRYCVNEIEVDNNGQYFASNNRLNGIEMSGARSAARWLSGSPHDLVCACVALLRAAGIPARPVVGVMSHDKSNREVFASWGEFYLPGAGWIPFDPVEMQKHNMNRFDVRQSWPGFGSMADLNRRVPMSYHFNPPTDAEAPGPPAIWGWEPGPGGDIPTVQIINIEMFSRRLASW